MFCIDEENRRGALSLNLLLKNLVEVVADEISAVTDDWCAENQFVSSESVNLNPFVDRGRIRLPSSFTSISFSKKYFAVKPSRS